MNATDSILTTLNAYDGDNIWQDVIYDLDVDQDTTDALDPSGRSDVIALTDGRVFRHDGIEWTEEPGEYAIRWEVRAQPDDDWGRPITYATATLARWNATEDMWSVIDTDGFDENDTNPDGTPVDFEASPAYKRVEDRLLAKHGRSRDNTRIEA